MPWVEDEAMSTQKSATVARATLPRGACGASEAKEWRWTLAAANGTLLANLVTLREGQSVVTYEFLGYSLTAGGRYFYALLSTEDLSLLPLPGSSLSSVDSAVLVSTSRAFRADGPPTGGDTVVDPWEGEAVTTAFVFETNSWNDEEDDLTYSFYAFPSTISQAAAFFDFQDPDSSRYFRKHDGVLMSPWAKTRKVFDRRMSPGRYRLLTRCRDRLGGEAEINFLHN